MIGKPKCATRGCIHFLGVRNPSTEKGGSFDESQEFVHCKAFPNGIPSEIAYGNNLHLKPYPGDNGIQYEEGVR